MAQYTTFREEWCSNRKRAQYISRTEESYSGNEVYHAGYDPWGRQTVTTNTIGFFRGYTRHEMLSDWNLINMNGRLYDPVLARFLSPDNFVQLPDNSQSYNRYSYCLNNPLKYTDPDGELFGIDDGILFFTIAYGALQGAFNASVSGKSIWKGALKGAAIGAISSIGTSAVGCILGHTSQSFGTELLRSGLHGLINGGTSALQGNSFWSGFTSGSLSSLAGSGAQALHFAPLGILGATTGAGALGAYATGGSAFDGMQIGFNIGLLNHLGGRKSIDPDGLTNYELDEITVTAPYILKNPPLMMEKPLETVYPEFWLILLGKGGYNLYYQKMINKNILKYTYKYAHDYLINQTGGFDQWLRIHNSYSHSGNFKSNLSICWGASPKYVNKIGNVYLRKLNIKLRNTKIPIDNWRTNDPGHLHLLK